MSNPEPETLAFCNSLKIALIATSKSARQIAKEVGLGHATLSRIAAGRPCDIDTYFKIRRWLQRQGDALKMLKHLVEQVEKEVR